MKKGHIRVCLPPLQGFLRVYIVDLTRKKERDQYPAILTEQAWSIKDLFYGIKARLHDRGKMARAR